MNNLFGGGGNSSTLAILEKIEALVAENQQLKEQISSMQNRFGMFDCSKIPAIVRNTSFSEVLSEIRKGGHCAGIFPYYSISDAPANVQIGFLLYAFSGVLGTQTSLLAFYSNKMAIGMMASDGKITWRDIT
ncbi:hypothetical protein IMSAGC007_04688 [Lachnospiraceae bacterium]|nr:hypothetical protein IMSAGC007_04688 [Lachnospiraceae bacterium]